MNFKKIFIVLIVSSLLIGAVCASSITDFKIDDGKVKEIFKDNDIIVYADEHSDSGIAIFKTFDKIGDKDTKDDDRIDNLVHDDGDEYITADEDMKLAKNPDHTANFTDADHGTMGLSEVIDHNGEKHVVVFWAKNQSHMNMTQLKADMDKFPYLCRKCLNQIRMNLFNFLTISNNS